MTQYLPPPSLFHTHLIFTVYTLYIVYKHEGLIKTLRKVYVRSDPQIANRYKFIKIGGE